MKKFLVLLAGVAAIGAMPQSSIAQSVGAKELANTQELIRDIHNGVEPDSVKAAIALICAWLAR